MQVKSFPVMWLLAVFSGVVYSLAYPPFGWSWLVFPGVAGLLLALRGQSGTRARVIGFTHGMAACVVGLSWLHQIFGAVEVVLWIVLAAFPALFADMQGRAALRGLGGWKLAAFTALNWGAWEFIRAELFPLKFPWMTAGLALGPNALLPWIGVYGVGVLVVFAVALVVLRMRLSALFVFIVFASVRIYFHPLSSPDVSNPRAVKVAGVQRENVTLDEFLADTRKLPDDIRHVVWPEYAVPYDLRKNRRDWKLVQDLCREKDITLTLGTQNRPGLGEEWRNIALTLDADGVRGEHNRIHTVHFFDDGTPGATALPVVTRHGKTGTPVCFDCDYEGVTRRMTAAGAEMFIVPIMDAASWSARQHDQHAELFRIRACENGRWMFVCASSGVSQVIDPHGYVHARLGALEQGTLTAVISRESSLTPYTRFGWLLPWCVTGVAMLGWGILLIPAKK